MLSLVLVMAILNGWFDLGEYETRAWSLPLISFLFGYASRKTASLIDRLLDRVRPQLQLTKGRLKHWRAARNASTLL